MRVRGQLVLQVQHQVHEQQRLHRHALLLEDPAEVLWRAAVQHDQAQLDDALRNVLLEHQRSADGTSEAVVQVQADREVDGFAVGLAAGRFGVLIVRRARARGEVGRRSASDGCHGPAQNANDCLQRVLAHVPVLVFGIRDDRDRILRVHDALRQELGSSRAPGVGRQCTSGLVS